MINREFAVEQESVESVVGRCRAIENLSFFGMIIYYMDSGETEMKKNVSQNPNPALKDLEILAGNWKMELSNASFLPSSSDIVTGHVSFDWLEGGAFLVIYMGDPSAGTPDAIWLISRDESASNYTVLYYDTRKVSRVYEMSFSDGTWKMWRNSPTFSQRFEGKFSKDGNTITAHWEKSSDGSTWEHDFDVAYTRAR